MNIQDQGKENLALSPRTLHSPVVWVAVITLAVVCILLFSFFTGSEMVLRYAPLIDATMEIKLEAAIGHLWFEEIIQGDRTVVIEEVWEYFDQAEWYARAMLEGGQNEEGKFKSVKDPDLIHDIEVTLEGIREFRSIAQERWRAQSQSGIGSDIDQRFDVAFEKFQASADKAETTLQHVMRAQLGRFRVLNSLLIAAVVLLGAIIGVILQRNERRRKSYILELQSKEENLRITFDSIGDAVITTDTQGKIVRMNPVAESLTGWTLEGAWGKALIDVFDIVNSQTQEPAFNPVKKVLEDGKIIGLANHTMLISKDGARYHIADSAAPIRNGSGGIVGVVLVFRDMTEEYKTQESLKKAQLYISNILDSMPSILVGVDLDGNITQWNNEASRKTGLEHNEAMGQPLEKAIPHLADQMQRVQDAMKTREVRTESRVPRKEKGEMRFENVTVFPLIANGMDGAVIRVDDVTEQVRIEEMMVQSEKMLSVGGLAAGMAHEINNPLAGMMQTTDVIIRRMTNLDLRGNQQAAKDVGTSMEVINDYMKSRDIIKMLGRIRESGNRAAEIVSNMLSFARKSESTFSTHYIVDLIDQTVDLAGSDYDLKKRYDFRQIKIVREYEKDLPFVPCDAGKIQQVVLNILRNGSEAMQKKLNIDEKPRFILRLAHEKEACRIRIEIEDNGPGMSDATRKRVFEPFFTTKPTDQGTGLGMSVSFFIITENHAGEMTVESTLGKGTKFIITLPVSGRES